MADIGNPFAAANQRIAMENEGQLGPPPAGTPGAPDARVQALGAVQGAIGKEAAGSFSGGLGPQFLSSGQIGQRFTDLQAELGGTFPDIPPVTTTQQLALFGLAMQNPQGALDLVRARSRRVAENRRAKAEMDLRLMGLARDSVNAENEIAYKRLQLEAKATEERRRQAEFESQDMERGARINWYNAQAEEIQQKTEARDLGQARLGAFMGKSFQGGPTLDEYGNPISAPSGFESGTLGGAAYDMGPELQVSAMQLGESGGVTTSLRRQPGVLEIARSLMEKSAASGFGRLEPDEAIRQAVQLVEGSRRARPTLGELGGEGFGTYQEDFATEEPPVSSKFGAPLP